MYSEMNPYMFFILCRDVALTHVCPDMQTRLHTYWVSKNTFEELTYFVSKIIQIEPVLLIFVQMN